MEQDIKACIAALENGGTILYPTDTVWGVGCDALNGDAVDKVYSLKQRPKEKSMIVLLAEAKDIIQYIAAPPPDIIAMLEEFERPTTVIYEGALGFPENVPQEDGSLAIRVCNDPFCKALIKRLGKPIVSTSANLSGEPTPKIYEQISPEIRKGCDYVVKYRQDDKALRQPSQLVRIAADGSLEILRA